MMREGALAPLVDDHYAFDELPCALQDLAHRRSAGKLMLKVRDMP
jgi:NADPH:quinone reductase-like Zn-dependent oxidoreductase